MLHFVTSIIWAAPSAMAKGQLYSPEDGLNKYSLLIWYSRLEHVHHTTSADPSNVHNTISLLSIPEEGLNKYSLLIWYKPAGTYMYTMQHQSTLTTYTIVDITSLYTLGGVGSNKYSLTGRYLLHHAIRSADPDKVSDSWYHQLAVRPGGRWVKQVQLAYCFSTIK